MDVQYVKEYTDFNSHISVSLTLCAWFIHLCYYCYPDCYSDSVMSVGRASFFA